MRYFFKTCIVAIALATGNIGLAQDQDRPKGNVDELAKLLDQALPEWDGRLLEVNPGKDWTAEINMDFVVNSLGVRSLAREAKQAPDGIQVLKNKRVAVRIDPAEGQIRFVDRSLTPDFSAEKIVVPSEDAAREIGMKVLDRLGLPREEFGELEILTQMAAGGTSDAKEPEVVDEILRLFVMQRQVNKLPVFGSNAVVALAGEGEIQRLRTQWPAFEMDPDGKILEREAVLKNTAEELLDQNVSSEAKISAQLGYMPLEGVPGADYIPVALIAVEDDLTPLLISAPLVQAGGRDD